MLCCFLVCNFDTQKYFYRFSKSRGKADYFEGRDDSGVVSARFLEDYGGTAEYRDAYSQEEDIRERLLEYQNTARFAMADSYDRATKELQAGAQ